MCEETDMELDDRGQWFVVQVRSGLENKVCEAIKYQIKISDQVPVYEAVIPTEVVAAIRKGDKKMTESRRKLFPGYIWVRLDLYDEFGQINEPAWTLVRGVQGVLGFLGGNRPRPLTADEVDAVLRPFDPESGDKPRQEIVFEVGEVVRIKDGLFEGSEGTVQEVDNERGKLKLMVSMFGRSTPVELKFWQAERIL